MRANGARGEQREELVAGKSERSVPRTSGPAPPRLWRLAPEPLHPFYHGHLHGPIDRNSLPQGAGALRKIVVDAARQLDRALALCEAVLQTPQCEAGTRTPGRRARRAIRKECSRVDHVVAPEESGYRKVGDHSRAAVHSRSDKVVPSRQGTRMRPSRGQGRLARRGRRGRGCSVLGTTCLRDTRIKDMSPTRE